jgi:hypothetical protein
MEFTGHATAALGLKFSEQKFRKIDPGWYKGGLLNTFLSLIGAGLKSQIQSLSEQLAQGDSNPAVVVQLSPLLVAAYSPDLDCVVLLKFEAWVAQEYKLEVGSQLITVNAYMERSMGVPADVKPGPNDDGQFGAFIPIIADFVTDDVETLDTRRAQINEEEWSRVRELGEEALARKPLLVRDGRPTACGRPGSQQ